MSYMNKVSACNASKILMLKKNTKSFSMNDMMKSIAQIKDSSVQSLKIMFLASYAVACDVNCFSNDDIHNKLVAPPN